MLRLRTGKNWSQEDTGRDRYKRLFIHFNLIAPYARQDLGIVIRVLRISVKIKSPVFRMR